MEKRQTYNIYTTCYGGNAGANARNNLCKSILFRIVYLNKSFLHFFSNCGSPNPQLPVEPDLRTQPARS